MADFSFNDSASLLSGLSSENNMGLSGPGMMGDQESAEDLSMKGTPQDMFGVPHPGRMGEAELMMRIKQEVQDVYPELYFDEASHRQQMEHHKEMGHPQTPSPSQDERDVQGIEVKGGQMVMMPDMMERYEDEDEEGEIRRMEDEEENERRMRRIEHVKNKDGELMGSGNECDMDEDSNPSDRYPERKEGMNKMSEEEMSILEARARAEAEAERELFAVKEKFEREQAEDLRAEMDKNYPPSGLQSMTCKSSNSNQSNVRNQGTPPLTIASQFTALNATDEERNTIGPFHHQDLASHENHFLNEMNSEDTKDIAQRFDKRGQHSSDSDTASTSLFFNNKYKKGGSSFSASPQAEDSIEEPATMNSKQMSRPFIVQLPDSGPVFPTPQRQSVVPSQSPTLDTVISSAS